MISAAPVLEVIVCSVADALEAQRGGAGRLEIIRDFHKGGLTPPLELVQEILVAVTLPVRVMLRESENYTVADEREIELLCGAADELKQFGVGLVLGFINDEHVDLELCRRVLSCASGLKATFHHAFEETRDPGEAIAQLKAAGQVDRILTSGGRGDWSQKIERLGSYERKATPEIKILAGGGLNLERLRTIRANTGIKEFHVGRAARFESRIDGPVQAELVHELVKALEE